MCQTNDGFKIAEEDLKIRGPGDIDGTQQSGAVALKLANIAEDGNILEMARNKAYEIIEQDPHLTMPKHLSLRNYVNTHLQHNPWSKIS
jgi:ATP-dependent DNA helicase RecG